MLGPGTEPVPCRCQRSLGNIKNSDRAKAIGKERVGHSRRAAANIDNRCVGADAGRTNEVERNRWSFLEPTDLTLTLGLVNVLPVVLSVKHAHIFDHCRQETTYMSSAPILANKDPCALSVFEPAALLREARRQKALPVTNVPPLCVLDPDGDIVRLLRLSGQAKASATWPCY